MEEKKQFEIVWELLAQFQSEGILKNMMLVGSWCLYFYRMEYKQGDLLPAIRTLDIDFLLSKQKSFSKDVNVPAMLRQMGFVSTHDSLSGAAVYDHPGLRVEFLIPELGKGNQSPQKIKPLHIDAQPLRYLNFLLDYPKEILRSNIRLTVPEPAAFSLHKLILSSKRLNSSKRKKDLETAIGLLDFLLKITDERSRLRKIMDEIPKSWRRTIQLVARVHYPKLLDI